MKKTLVQVNGISPLLMHAFPMVPVEGMEKKPPLEQAEISLYRLSDGKIYVPGLCLSRCLVRAAAFSKGKGRASLAKIVAATVSVSPDAVILSNQVWELDARRVVIAATRGAVIRYRPRFDQWSLEFDLTWDDTLLTEAQIRRVVDDAGQKVGILDFRPERMGPFGRFIVTRWAAK